MLIEAVGYQDLESKQPMKADTIFRIASMTKPFTAVGIMILVEEGQGCARRRRREISTRLQEFVGDREP
jgi:hypothetical protein